MSMKLNPIVSLSVMISSAQEIMEKHNFLEGLEGKERRFVESQVLALSTGLRDAVKALNEIKEIKRQANDGPKLIPCPRCKEDRAMLHMDDFDLTDQSGIVICSHCGMSGLKCDDWRDAVGDWNSLPVEEEE